MSAHRTWQLDGDPFLTSPEDLEVELHQAANILARVGGVILIAAQREEIAPDHFVTTGYAFTWRSYAPARRMEPVETEAVPEPELEPQAATA